MATAREGSAALVHPTYAQFKATWGTARDLYEGTGGFMDEKRPYLVPHPREWLDHSLTDQDTGKQTPNPSPILPSPKLSTRRKLARYENVAATILDAVAGALFLQTPTRSFGAGKENEQILAWWSNCDGKGTDLTTFMRESWLVAGVFGHTPMLMEKPEQEAATAADQGLPYVCRYTPLDVLDWLEDDGQKLIAVKLGEIAPRSTFGDPSAALSRIRVRIVDDTEWRLYGPNGGLLKGAAGRGAHGFGELPVEILYAKRRLLTPFIGKSVMGDPQLYIDLYNLISEVRELLRNQTFAILNIPIGPEGSVQTEQEKMGRQSGTSSALITSEPAQYISPSGDNVAAYHEHIDRLARMIYRLASAPWEGDSKDAESADSRRIKRNEYDQILKTFALELQRCEKRLTALAYRALYGELAERRMEQEQVNIVYPTSFQPIDHAEVIQNVADAVGLDLGETAMKELKKRVVRVTLPDVDKEMAQKIDKDIDGQKYVSEEDKRQEDIDAAAKRFAA